MTTPIDFIDKLQQKEKEQSILLCVGNRIAAARKREDLIDIISDQLLDLFGARYYALCLLNEDPTTHSPFLYSRQEQFTRSDQDNPLISAAYAVEDGVFNLAIASDTPLILDFKSLLNQEQVPFYIHKWNKMGMNELLTVKITNGLQTKGVLYLYADNTGTFSPEKFNLLTGIVDQLGTGICNIMANEKIERQLEEIKLYKHQLEEENLYLQQQNKLTDRFSELIGTGDEMQKVFRLISQVAPSDSTVLLLGETGTGKELVARAIHNASGRSNKLMIKVNCAAMPASLIESELFGHEKGSFTGAADRRIGKFELANNSTLFLDEIGEMPLELQVKILRVLQEKEIERIGGKNTIKVNVRIIAATNRNLEKEVQAGRFRSDLYYRLNVFPIVLPPLRRHKEDIAALAAHFMERYARNTGKKITNISTKAMKTLETYSWPGNIRELEHLIERTILLTNGNIITQVDLPGANGSDPVLTDEEFVIRPLEDIERAYLLKVIKRSNGRISGPNGAAFKLGMPSTTLISKMKKLGIKKEHFVREEY